MEIRAQLYFVRLPILLLLYLAAVQTYPMRALPALSCMPTTEFCM
jgi:hypothetical protein